MERLRVEPIGGNDGRYGSLSTVTVSYPLARTMSAYDVGSLGCWSGGKPRGLRP